MAIKERYIQDGKQLKVLIEKEIKAYASGAHVILPKKYAGKIAKIIIVIPTIKSP